MNNPLTILVTGCDGYIGAVLVPYLFARGHIVVGFDTGYYREGCLYTDPVGNVSSAVVINNDIRNINAEQLADIDAIVHLAELSNDPLGENSPDVTYDINHQGTMRLAQIAKQVGIERFVYTSSCSVYGEATEDVVSEQSQTNPQTAYARCKVMVENDLKEIADQSFTPVMLRNGTVHGASPRMRFDIVINNLAGMAWTAKKIGLTSDGSPWRPLVHIDDICQAIACSLEAPAAAVSGQVFNVGQDSDNYRIRDLANTIGEVFIGSEVTMGPPSGDNRSYKVSFDKIKNQLPGFVCQRNVRYGIEELYRLFQRIQLDETMFTHRAFTRLRGLNYLLDSGQIDNQFYWTRP